MPIDLLASEPRDLLAQEPKQAESSWRQGPDPTMFDRVLDLFSDPKKEKARAVNAIVDAEALGIRPDVAYEHKTALDKYYNIDPDRKAKKERTLQAIKKFNDTGIEDGWMKSIWANAKAVPFQMQIAAGGLMQFIEENVDPELALNSMGAMVPDDQREVFRLAGESREKKIVRTLGEDVQASGIKKVQEIAPNVMPGSFKDTVGMATQSTLNNALFLIPGLGFGRAFTLAGMGMQSFGQTYGEQRAAGIDKGTATLASLINGGAEIATEFIPTGIYLKPKASFVRRIAEAEFSEIPGESLNTLINDVVDKSTIRPDMTVEEMIEDIQKTIQVTALSTAALSGTTHSIHKTIARAVTDPQMKADMNEAKKEALDNGATPQEAMVAAIDAIKSTPEGEAFVDQKISELKTEADGIQGKGRPFIIGVNEDANGEITSFKMADPKTGSIFEVPAMHNETDKNKVTIVPDMEAVNAKMKELNTIDPMDARLDRIIEGAEDINQAAGEIFSDDIDEMAWMQEEAKPETILQRVKAINDAIGEKGSIDIGPVVELGRSILAEGHQTIEAFTARAKELLSDVWDNVKDIVSQAWATLNNERGSMSWKKAPTVEEINMMLSTAARQDKEAGLNFIPESYKTMKEQAAQIAMAKIEKKLTARERKEAAALARQGEQDARLMPTFAAMTHIVNAGGINLKSLQADYDGDTIRELMNRRPGLVSKRGKLGPDVFADQFGFESGDDLVNAILNWKGLKAEGANQSKEFLKYYEKAIGKADFEALQEEFNAEERKAMQRLSEKFNPRPARGIKREIRQRTGQAQPGNRMVTEYDALTEAFRKEANTARKSFIEGKQSEIEKSKEAMRWLIKRRESMKNVRDYFGLTDSEMMSVTKHRNPALMDDTEFQHFLKNVQQKAVELAENKQAKIELLRFIEDKRLQKVDNYRQALQLPTIDKMDTAQLRMFAKLLEPFQEDDVFLTQRELETVDRTDLKGIKTWREAKEKLAQEVGIDVDELNKVHVAWSDSFRWDSALRERDPFFDMLVMKMTESMLGAELRAHNIETEVYKLANESENSRERGLVGRMIPQDDQIMAFLEAPMNRKAAISSEMTPAQLNYASYIQQYFAHALNYLIATKSLERGRENYFVHIRKSFLENVTDGGLKKAISELFKSYEMDQVGFNILDDDTGNILPLEKFFQYTLHRSDVMDPTRNVTKAFLTYVRTFEKKKMFDAIIPKLDIYTQALTPMKYTPRGLEYDASLKKFVNKWINNKKGRKISYDSVIRQGGPVDVGIRALRTFTTMLDLGFAPITQIASFIGEQAATSAMIGPEGMAKGTARMATDKGKRILDKYEAFTGRSFWENFTAPGKEITERLTEAMFGLFHVSAVTANKQFLLASLTESEWNAEEISNERLAQMRLDMGRFRSVPGTSSLVGSTSAGDAATQYKGWAIPILRSTTTDALTFARNLKNKAPGEALTSREAKEVYRIAGLTTAALIVGSMGGADDEDRSFVGKLKSRMYREAMTLMQGVDPKLWLSTPRVVVWLAKLGEALHNIVILEEYKTKEGLKGVGQLKQQVEPLVIRQIEEND